MKIFKRIILILSVLFLLFIGLIVVPYFANIVMPWQRNSAIRTTIEWGGLADLPENAKDVSVDTKGSMFTREFIIEFVASETEINGWIKQSKRLNVMVPIQCENGAIKYEIYPGEKGAIGGTVIIDRSKRKVVIDMSWS